MTASAFEQILVWTGAGIGALGAAVLVAGTAVVALFDRDAAPAPQRQTVEHGATDADLPLAA